MLALAVLVIAAFDGAICLFPDWGQRGSPSTPPQHRLETWKL